jgi:steroid 5-alpha reductase family enzyme
MTMSTLAVLVAMTAVMFAGWLFQRARNNGGWTDVFWTLGTGATCAVATLLPYGAAPGAAWRSDLVAAMMAIWSLRLGIYVARRVARSGEDPRYAELRREWGGDFQGRMFWLLILQAPITALIAVSILFAARQPVGHFRVLDLLGLAIFVTALTGEALADSQMKSFKADHTNAGMICDVGLWGWSRHPNYFFEALIWVAYPLMGLDFARPWSLLALLAPVMMFCIVRFGTGVPPLEAAMVRSKGDAYRRYQTEVSVLFPWPPSIKRD